MDERLQKALEFSKYMESIRIEKENIRAKFLNAIMFSYGGGRFRIDKNLLTFLSSEIHIHKQTDTFLEDENNNPIFIENIQEFYDKCRLKYYEALNEWYSDSEKLRRKRTVKSILEI